MIRNQGAIILSIFGIGSKCQSNFSSKDSKNNDKISIFRDFEICILSTDL